MYPRSKLYYGLFAALILQAGCGDGRGGSGNPINQLVRSVAARTYQQDGDAWGEVTVTLNTGAVTLPSVDLPVADPRTPELTYGRLSMRSGFNGTTDIGVAINISDVSNRPGLDPVLPNGVPIPVGGLDGTQVIALQAGRTNTRVYAAFSKAVALLGAAIPIKEFDKLGQYVGGANLFPAFTFPNGIRGVAGIFTGRQEGQSGVAFFVDAGAVLNQPKPIDGSPKLATLSAKPTQPENDAVQATFRSLWPSSKKQEKIYRYLYDLNQKRTRLRIH